MRMFFLAAAHLAGTARVVILDASMLYRPGISRVVGAQQRQFVGCISFGSA